MHGGEWSFRERLCSIPPANRDFQLISRKKTRATWHALITQAFLPPPVLKVMSCDYGWCMGGVEGGVEVVWYGLCRVHVFSSVCSAL